MKGILVAIIASVFLVGCETTPTIKTETKTVFVPVPYVPAPPVKTPPELAVDSIAEQPIPEDPIARGEFYGRLAQAYRASMVALQGYVKELEATIAEYERLSRDSKTLEDLIKQEAEKAKPQ
jgi:hypothetical protein